MLKQLLFRVAKSPLTGQTVGYAFQCCSWAIPVKKVHSNRDVLAFCHPQPSYENHLIISPKKAIRTLQQMASDDLSKYFVAIWETVKDIRAMHPEYRDAFVLVANGGKRQEVQQVHFHLFTNHEMVRKYAAHQAAENVFDRDENICVFEHPDPDWEVHFITRPVAPSRSEQDQHAYFRSVLQSIDALDARFHIVQRGYALVYQRNQQTDDREYPVFHIVSGKKLKREI